MSTFKAIVVDKSESGQSVALKDFDEKDLMEADVTVRPEWSTINYKDGLAITGKAPVVRRFPMIAGVDLAGTVENSSHPDWKAGDKVICNGWGLGETHLGAYAQKARVKGDWLVRVPETMNTRDAMAIGTAGYTAMLAVIALERAGLTPDKGPVIVTGAAGGVGSVAVALLAKLGYAVIASTGRPQEGDYLKGLGASRDPRSQGARRPGKAPGQGALGRRRRLGRFHDPRQCPGDDPLWRGGRGLRPCRRHGPAFERRPVYFARGVAFGHQFRHVPAAQAKRGVEKARNRSGPDKIGRNDLRNSPLWGDRNRPEYPFGRRPGSNRGQDRVNSFSIWLRNPGMIARRYGKGPVNSDGTRARSEV